MKRLWFSISLLLIALISCKNQKIIESGPLNTENSMEVFVDDVPPLSDSVQLEINVESGDVFQIKHQSDNQQEIDSVKAKKNNSKRK